MGMNGRERLVYGQAALMLALLLALAAIDRFSVAAFYTGSFVAFLCVVEFTSSVVVRPPWRRRLQRVLIAATMVFGLVVLRELWIILATR